MSYNSYNKPATYEKKEVTVKTSRESLMSVQKNYIDSISKGLESIIGKMGQYQALCGYNMLNAINTMLAKDGLDHRSPKLDKESVNNAIKFAVVYGLNTDNREVFCIIRNEKHGTEWIKKVEVKPQYKGVIKILSSFGRDVKRVFPEWIVREGDDFKYATYKGVEVCPPEWTPKSNDGKVLRVVVPVQYEDGFIDYRIAERESVALNIKAQLKQTLMTKTDVDGARINAMVKDYTLDQLFSCKEIEEYLNPTYTGLSREEMIITKLIINATKRVTIDYEKALPNNAAIARELNEKTFDNSDVYVKSHNAKELLEQQDTPLEIEANKEEEITVADENGEVQPVETTDNAPKTDKNTENSEEDWSLDNLFNDNEKQPF